jgi:hypothetical protein
MDLFLKIPNLFDLAKIPLSPESFELMEAYSTPQKYGLALKKQRAFTSIPNTVYHTNDRVLQAVYDCLPSALLAIEEPTVKFFTLSPPETVEAAMLAPHVDVGRKCCLNLYIDAHKEKSIYYEYYAGKIKEVASFVAETGECWLMDVSKPHAVLLSPPHVRRALTISFIETPYSEVVKHFHA